MSNTENMVLEIAKKAKKSSIELVKKSNLRNLALKHISENILKNADKIIFENAKDLRVASENGLSDAMLDRLKLDKNRIDNISKGVKDIITLPDPLGKVIKGHVTENGLKISQITVPLGVVGIIYESRPNVTVDTAALALKSGNCIILRGGKEAINSNICLANIMRESLRLNGLPEDCVQIITDTSRDSATCLMKLTQYLDVLIPRGGKSLIKSVVENAGVPVIQTGAGNCHIYVDESADISMATEIIYNAKTSRPSVCNACETVLVHSSVANKALPAIKNKLKEKDVILHCCSRSYEILGKNDIIATEEDWYKEYLDYEIAVKVVDGIDEAIEHINKYSTGHSEAIITENFGNYQKFVRDIDSSAVYINASTRFTDGGEFGMGAEIGISTQKLHARGPMGIDALTSTKFVIEGNGQIR